jgi:hypothetical protein
MSLTMQEQPSGGYRVCLTEKGITVCTYVDSMHCAYSKEKYLRANIDRQAAAAIEDS